MRNSNGSPLRRLLRSVLGTREAERALACLWIDPALDEEDDDVSREVLAMALNVVLFADLAHRVPSAARYAARKQDVGQRIRFDHGALRTVRFATGPTGAIPAGFESFARILEPLGYVQDGIYELPRLRMTGRAFRHRDLPFSIPQFFVSELHVERFDGGFQQAARRIFASTRDPLTPETKALLESIALIGVAEFGAAAAALPNLAEAFACHHDVPIESDYERLLSASAEAAWIATEGNAFNHAADLVEDVDALAAALRADGWATKPAVEVSASGRIRQTALRADAVERPFLRDGAIVRRMVPGSFFEFITRAPAGAAGTPDLSFDSGNATGIFGMTRAA